MAPRRTQTTAAKTTAAKTADDDKNQETAAEQQAKDDGQAKAQSDDKKTAESKTDKKPDSDKVDITKGTENREPIPAPEQHQDRAMNELDRQVSNAATVGVEGSEEAARKRMLQVSQIDTSSQSGYTDVFRAMVNPPENAVKASKAEAKSADSKKN